MRVLIAGIDGYLGWALALYLTNRGHDVAGIDGYMRRDWVAEMGGASATPIRRMTERLQAFNETFRKPLIFRRGDIMDYNTVRSVFRSFRPDTIVHLAEMPSAPYSMIDVEHCVYTQTNNMVGTLNILHAMRDECPDAHLLKLGTMGEYGTPNVDIPEGMFELEFRGRTQEVMFPRTPGSWYHQSKVHDTDNVIMACRLWGLRSTDIMQGVVYGTRIDEMGDDPRLITRFDYDQSFGTAINRFCAQAVVGYPITPYGKGKQSRGFLPLRDSMQCLTLATENPPEAGEYRVFNQFEEVYNVTELAQKVAKVAVSMGMDPTIRRIENPRQEDEDNYYNPDHQKLLDLGYKPTTDMEGELKILLTDLVANRDRIAAHAHTLTPDVRWDGSRRECVYLDDDE